MLLNRSRAEDAMARNNLVALVASSPANVFYSSDMCPYGNSLAILPLDGNLEPALITPVSTPTPAAVMSPPWFSDVRYFGEFYTETRWAKEPLDIFEKRLMAAQNMWETRRERDPVNILFEVFEEKGLKKGAVGVDEFLFPQFDAFRNRIGERFPALDAVKASKLFLDIRQVKTAEEVRRVKEATRITENAWKTALESCRAGMSEEEFAQIFEASVSKMGGRLASHMGFYGAPIAFGRRTAFVDLALPSNYRLRSGDLIRFDGGCSFMGYQCDMARTAVLGPPNEKQSRYYDALSRGVRLAVEMAEAGAVASDLFSSVVKTVRESGIPHYRRHHVGHGWGIEGYDPPSIGPNDEAVLVDGMLLCLEAPYYEIGFGGLILEEIVLVKGGRSQRLTGFSSDLLTLDEK